EEYRRAGTDAVRAFSGSHAERIGYHVFLQYLADSQLKASSELALKAGMRLGLYRDLAVGADRGGSEIWSHPERFANGVS
ncbi:4-alpha-glucanotransferase, partial [Acinetobacter baumannii]